jgi:hypothetical protein
MIDITTENIMPSPYLIFHHVWEFLSVHKRQLLVKADKAFHPYAIIRQRAASRLLFHLKQQRLDPANDQSPQRLDPANDPSPICQEQVYDMGAALVRFNMNYGDLLRWLGGEYTYQYQDRSLLTDLVETIRSAATPPDYPPVNHEKALRILTDGVPAKASYTSCFQSAAKRNRENNRRLQDCWEEIMDKYWKEGKRSYHIMFPRVIWRFIPGLFLSIIAYIPPKPGRLGDEGRIICDPSNPLNGKDVGMVNKQIPKCGKEVHECENPRVYYGTAVRRMFKLIYNLRTDHPNEEIFIIADDISAAFRWLQFHPDIAPVFAQVLGNHLVIPVGMIFGAANSPSYFMIWEELRSRLAATIDIGEATMTLSLNTQKKLQLLPQQQVTCSTPASQQSLAVTIYMVSPASSTTKAWRQ